MYWFISYPLHVFPGQSKNHNLAVLICNEVQRCSTQLSVLICILATNFLKLCGMRRALLNVLTISAFPPLSISLGQTQFSYRYSRQFQIFLISDNLSYMFAFLFFYLCDNFFYERYACVVIVNLMNAVSELYACFSFVQIRNERWQLKVIAKRIIALTANWKKTLLFSLLI